LDNARELPIFQKCQPLFATVMLVGQPRVAQPQQAQGGRVQIVDVNALLDVPQPRLSVIDVWPNSPSRSPAFRQPGPAFLSFQAAAATEAGPASAPWVDRLSRSGLLSNQMPSRGKDRVARVRAKVGRGRRGPGETWRRILRDGLLRSLT